MASSYGEVFDIVNSWKLAKRTKNGAAAGYYYRVCDWNDGLAQVVARITWRDYQCEDQWFLSWGNLEEHHTLAASVPLGLTTLQNAMRKAELILNAEGLY